MRAGYVGKGMKIFVAKLNADKAHDALFLMLSHKGRVEEGQRYVRDTKQRLCDEGKT